MAITWTTPTAVTVSATEFSFVSQSTSLATDANQGLYSIKIGLENMSVGDTYKFRLYEKAGVSATKRVQETWTFTGPSQDLNVPSLPLGNGWDFTGQLTAGTNRIIFCTIIKVS